MGREGRHATRACRSSGQPERVAPCVDGQGRTIRIPSLPQLGKASQAARGRIGKAGTHPKPAEAGGLLGTDGEAQAGCVPPPVPRSPPSSVTQTTHREATVEPCKWPDAQKTCATRSVLCGPSGRGCVQRRVSALHITVPDSATSCCDGKDPGRRSRDPKSITGNQHESAPERVGCRCRSRAPA